MRVLQIGSDRSKRGILYPGTPAFERQVAYANAFGHLDVVGFSLKRDGAQRVNAGALTVYPTNSFAKALYGINALFIALTLPKPDVVSAQDPFEAGLIAWLVAALKGVPLHVQVHTDLFSEAYAAHSLGNRLRTVIARFVLSRAAGVRAVSDRIRSSVERRFTSTKRIAVIPMFADVERMRVGLRDNGLEHRFSAYAPKLLVVSRLEAEKNVERAIRAYASTASKDAALIIVGDGKERTRLERLVKALSAKHVFFEGERVAAPYYTLADLVLVPSAYEGYGLTIVEALAAGKPVLSTDVGIAREAGAIVAAPDMFSNALVEWFKNGPRTSELKAYPYTSFEEYVRTYCDDILACIETKKTQ